MWSISNYQPGEITDLAVTIEKRGGEFYKKLAEKASNESAKKLLLYLAAEEEQHQVRFMDLGRDLTPVDAPESYQGEYLEYLEFAVEAHLFNQGDQLDQLVENASSGLDIINLAIAFERDTIMFFNGFRNVVKKDQQAIIEDLIMEEEIHLVKLSRIRKELVRDGQ